MPSTMIPTRRTWPGSSARAAGGQAVKAPPMAPPARVRKSRRRIVRPVISNSSRCPAKGLIHPCAWRIVYDSGWNWHGSQRNVNGARWLRVRDLAATFPGAATATRKSADPAQEPDQQGGSSMSHMSQSPEISSRVGAILRSTGGNFLEMFDFFLFGFYASYIAKAFFPTVNEVNGLLLTFTTFWLGALMRPVGAIVLGAYIDRIGRRKGLIVSLGIMALGTVFIAVTPTYASIGIAAPIIVLIGRLLQGFSAGVELGGVS